MAYVVSSLTTSQATSGTSFVPGFPAHQTNDLLLVLVTNDGGGTNLSFGSTTATLTAATDLCTYAGSDIFQDTDQIEITTTGNLTGTNLSLLTRYWIRDLDTTANTFKLAASSGGAAIDITGAGTGTHTFHIMSDVSTGWEFIGFQAASGANRSAWCYKVAASSSETSPTVTGANDDFGSIALCIRDVDTANPFGSVVEETDYKRGDYTGATTAASPAVTTTNNENLLIYSWSSDGNVGMTVPLGGLSHCDLVSGAGATTAVVGWLNQYTSGAIPSVTMTRTSSTNGGNSWALAVKNKSGGGLKGECIDVASNVRVYGTGFEAGTYTAPNTNPPNIATIDTVGMSAINSLADSTFYEITQTSTESTTNWVGGWDSFTSKDLSGAILSMRWVAPAVISSGIGTRGLIVVFADSNNYWKAFRLARNALGQMVGGGTYRSFIDIDGGTSYDSGGGGTFQSNDVVRIGLLVERTAVVSSRQFIFNPIYNHSSAIVFAGGNNDTPATPADIDFSSAEGPALSAYGFYGLKDLCNKQGSQQLVLPVSCQFGDGGTTPTYIDFSASSIETPIGYTDNYLWNVADSKLTVSIYAGASDVMDFSAGVLRANTRQYFTINASSSTSATYNFNGRSFIGWDVTWKTGVTCTGATFSGCGPVNFKGASPTNITVNDTLATSSEAAISFDANGATLTTSTVDLTGTSAGYHISLGASVTSITLNGNTFTGTPTNFVDKIYSELNSGTLTITWDGSGTEILASDVTFVGGSTAVAVISAPQVYQEVVVSGFTVGSRIQIYDVTSATELFNGTASAGNTVVSGSTATWTDPSAASGSRAIRVRVSYVSGATADLFQELSGLTCGTTSGTESVTYPVTPEDDTVYNANGIDGPAIYATSGITFTDAATDLINCNIGGGTVSWATIYACFVHWLNTSTGIDDDVTYIDAVDTANYLLTSMKIRNTSATPLTLTGGWGRDSTTLTIADCIDVAGSTGNIYPLPDHVVAYATGSGLTAGEAAQLATAATSSAQAVTDIAALPTAAEISTQVLSDASSTPIASNIKQVNDVTVTGTGADNDTWGPA